MKFIYLLVAVILATAAGWSQAADKLPCDNFEGTGLSVNVYNHFANKVMTAISKRDASLIASEVRFPIKAGVNGKRVMIQTAKEFERNFSKIFTDDFLSKLEKNTSTDTVCRDQGVGWAHGSLWINAPDFLNKPNVLKIISINN